MPTSSALERFLRYVTYDTQADPASTTYPSSEGQLVLLRVLADELRALGLDEVAMDPRYGYVTATIPANTDKPDVPVIGFIAHVDTSPEMSGRGVEPIVHRNYRGGDLVLPQGGAVIPGDDPHLREQIGNDIVTASGTTLLGADNKAGVAEIVAAAEILMKDRTVRHGKVRIAFTPDEEIGKGTLHFDVEAFGCAAAYTVDSESRGQLDTQTFSADMARVTFHGFNTHPGYAKGKMVNALKVACDFVSRLPGDRLSPETTEGFEGFVHPNHLESGVERSSVSFILRDFDTARLAEQRTLLETLARETVADHPGARYEIEVVEQYRNMKQVLDQHPQVVENAREAIRRAELPLRELAIRGGTDGAWLSFKGLPTPNIFAGEHNYHSRYEWVSVQDMEKAVEVIVNLARIWEERA